jgi:hypothetical protein
MTCANISRGRTARPAPRSSAKRRSRDGQARPLVIGKRPLLLSPGLCHPVNAIVFCHDHGLRHANEPLFLLAIVVSPGFLIADSGDRFRFGSNAILRARGGYHECDTHWSCQHDAEFVHLTPPSSPVCSACLPSADLPHASTTSDTCQRGTPLKRRHAPGSARAHWSLYSVIPSES